MGRCWHIASVRKLINDREVKKVDDFSMIELEGVINEFIAGGKRHSQAQEIYTKVDEMLKKLCLLCA